MHENEISSTILHTFGNYTFIVKAKLNLNFVEKSILRTLSVWLHDLLDPKKWPQ